MRDDMRGYAVEHPGERDGVLVVDETGFLKKGIKSAGVQRPVFRHGRPDRELSIWRISCLHHSKGRTLIDRALYVPRSWIADRDRCDESAISDDVEFATKTVLARQMLARSGRGSRQAG